MLTLVGLAMMTRMWITKVQMMSPREMLEASQKGSLNTLKPTRRRRQSLRSLSYTSQISHQPEQLRLNSQPQGIHPETDKDRKSVG